MNVKSIFGKGTGKRRLADRLGEERQRVAEQRAVSDDLARKVAELTSRLSTVRSEIDLTSSALVAKTEEYEIANRERQAANERVVELERQLSAERRRNAEVASVASGLVGQVEQAREVQRGMAKVAAVQAVDPDQTIPITTLPDTAAARAVIGNGFPPPPRYKPKPRELNPDGEWETAENYIPPQWAVDAGIVPGKKSSKILDNETGDTVTMPAVTSLQER